MHREFQRYLPFREPRWRCLRVQALTDARPPARPSRRTDDEYVVRYYNFLLRWNAEEDDRNRVALFAVDPPMCYAHMIFHHDDREWRWLTEAHLLTGESDETIAAAFGTLPESIRLYEKIFYNVRDRMHNEQWVLKQIVGSLEARQVETSRGQISREQWQMLLKLFAYYGGREALRAIASAFPRTRPADVEDLDTWLDRAFLHGIRRNALVASRVVEINRFTSVQLMELYLQLLRINNEAASGPITEYEKNVEEALSRLHWVVGGRSSATSAERRDSELLSQWNRKSSEAERKTAGDEPEKIFVRAANDG